MTLRVPLNDTPRTLRAGRRWPPAPPRRPRPAEPFTGPEDIAAWQQSLGDLTGALDKLTRSPVLGEQTYQLNAAGQASDQYRVPFAALAITSTSASTLTVMADTPKGAAPGSGPGLAVIPPRGFVVVNMRAYAWTIYGGTQNDQVTVQAFTRSQPPVSVPGPLTGAALGTTTVTVGNAVTLSSDYPFGATPVTGQSGNQANAAAAATLPGAAGKTTWITGFELTAAGATAALVVQVTVTGTISGTLTYIFTFPAGVTTAAAPLIVAFPKPIPASAQNTAITVTLPAGGAGNTNAAAVAHGYQL